jgi:hypothetical protein
VGHRINIIVSYRSFQKTDGVYFVLTSTSYFTIYSYHPELQKLRSKIELLEAARDDLSQRMKNEIAQVLEIFLGKRFDLQRAYLKSEFLKGAKLSPCEIIRDVTAVVDSIKNILLGAGVTKLDEDAVQKVVENHTELLGGLIDLRTDLEKEKWPSQQWDSREAMACLSNLKDAYESLLSLKSFDQNKALEIQADLSKTKKELSDSVIRMSVELLSTARLHMCTIGSSHQLPTMRSISESSPDSSDDEFDMADEFGRMNLDGKGGINVRGGKECIVIFDEAGCIPSYELLGLSRLGLDIKSLVLVGDKQHQLPPYDSSQQGSSSDAKFVRKMQSSLLDISHLSQSGHKTHLTTQYRVPKDIACILNTHVYSGLYNTCPRALVPCSGLNVIHVKEDQHRMMSRKKYVNLNEIIRGCELIDELRQDDSISNILIITPVSTYYTFPFSIYFIF